MPNAHPNQIGLLVKAVLVETVPIILLEVVCRLGEQSLLAKYRLLSSKITAIAFFN